MIQNDLITMKAAFLFTPFLAQVLAAGFGLITREWRLVLQGGIALGLSTLITIISGVVAGLATGDASGRRELIGMAAAAQFAIYPAW